MDIIGFHVVTMGSRVGEYAQELYAADRYQDYLYWHGFGVEIAEALAEYWHRRIRQDLKIDGSDGATPEELIKTTYQGARYSFGYPACPNLEDQALLWQTAPARTDRRQPERRVPDATRSNRPRR